MTEVRKSKCISELMPLMRRAQEKLSLFPTTYDVISANDDNRIMTVYLCKVFQRDMGITSEGGEFLIDSGLGIPLAKAYHCARKYYFATLRNAIESEIATNAYVSVANFWWNWHPIIMEMNVTPQNAAILKEIKSNIQLDERDESDLWALENGITWCRAYTTNSYYNAELFKHRMVSPMSDARDRVYLMRTSFPEKYDVEPAEKDNKVLAEHLHDVFRFPFGITPDGGRLLVDSGLGMTMANAYYCASHYLTNRDDAQVAHVQMDAYRHISDFWKIWRPIVSNMSAENENDVILKTIMTEITVDSEYNINYLKLGMWLRNGKRGHPVVRYGAL